MWAAHQVHHSSEYFNLSTALRQTSTGAFLSWPFYLPMAILGVPPVVFGAVALIDLLYQYWVHTELVRKLGWIDRVLVTPSNHRVHHGQNDYCLDRNYGGIFILWDRLFGTFVEERDDEPVIYGIRKPLASYNAVWGNLNVYSDLWQRSRAASSWREALRLWIDSPAGRGVTPPPLDRSKVIRFDTGTRPVVRRYAALQYALLIPPATYFIATGAQLPMSLQVAGALLIALSVFSIGRLLEERASARPIETLRLITLGVLAAATFSPIVIGASLLPIAASLAMLSRLGPPIRSQSA